MFDKSLVFLILMQVDEALGKIKSRTAHVASAGDFTDSPEGLEKLDSICMLFIAVGDSLKNIDKITGGTLFTRYPEIDWSGVKGFRDIIAHHYFDIDAEQVFWICIHELKKLSATIKKMIAEIDEKI